MVQQVIGRSVATIEASMVHPLEKKTKRCPRIMGVRSRKKLSRTWSSTVPRVTFDGALFNAVTPAGGQREGGKI